jgi:hypothetical protein
VELVPQKHEQLSAVQLRDQHGPVAAQNRPEVFGEGIEVRQVGLGHRALARGVHLVHGGVNGAVGASPAEDQEGAALGAAHGQCGDVVGDEGDFLRAQFDHFFVVIGVVADGPGDVGLFQAADAVFEPRGAGLGPGPRQGLGVAGVGLEGPFSPRRVLNRDFGQGFQGRQFPGFGRIGQVPVRQVNDRGHVGEGQPDGLDRRFKTVRRALGGDHRHGGLAVAAEHRLQQVGLLGLGRHAGGGARPLNVDDHQGELGDHRQVQGLGFKAEPRAGGAGDAQLPAEAGADGRADGGDFVLRLEGPDPEILAVRQVLQNAGGRRDGVGPQEKGFAGEFRRGDEAQGRGLVARDLAVGAGLEFRLAHLEARRHELRDVRVVEARL